MVKKYVILIILDHFGPSYTTLGHQQPCHVWSFLAQKGPHILFSNPKILICHICDIFHVCPRKKIELLRAQLANQSQPCSKHLAISPSPGWDPPSSPPPETTEPSHSQNTKANLCKYCKLNIEHFKRKQRLKHIRNCKNACKNKR